jgi:hypothetical protein
MSIEDTIGYLDATNVCEICGKDLGLCGAFARVRHTGRMVIACGPMCLEVFQKDAAPFMARLRKIDHYRALKDITKQHTALP